MSTKQAEKARTRQANGNGNGNGNLPAPRKSQENTPEVTPEVTRVWAPGMWADLATGTPDDRAEFIAGKLSDNIYNMSDVMYALAMARHFKDHVEAGKPDTEKGFTEFRTEKFPTMRKPSEAERLAMYPRLMSEFGLKSTRELAAVCMVSNFVVATDFQKHRTLVPAEKQEKAAALKEIRSAAAKQRERDKAKSEREEKANALAARTVTVELPEGTDIPDDMREKLADFITETFGIKPEIK